MESRSFTIIKIVTSSGHVKGDENLKGRYKGTPMGVAKKMATRVCRNSKIKGQCTLFITIKETTRNSKNKEYTYKVKRVKDERTVIRNGVEITYKFSLKATRV